MNLDTNHKPVLLDEVVDFLRPHSEQSATIAFDGTLGGGGHSEALLSGYPGIFLIGVDQDARAIERCRQRLAPFSERTHIVQANFSRVKEVLDSIPAEFVPAELRGKSLRIDRALVDLGMSSDQLDDLGRGFSFQQDAPLDMRMSEEGVDTAASILNSASASDLRKIFLQGGLSKAHTASLVKLILLRRPLATTADFRGLCEESLPPWEQAKSRHPATVPFQCLRIAVNDEIGAIERFLKDVHELLAPNGRLAVIAFHSLEDQIVTREMRRWAQRRMTLMGSTTDGLLLTKKAVTPTAEEISANPRARSARLRVFERGSAD